MAASDLSSSGRESDSSYGKPSELLDAGGLVWSADKASRTRCAWSCVMVGLFVALMVCAYTVEPSAKICPQPPSMPSLPVWLNFACCVITGGLMVFVVTRAWSAHLCKAGLMLAFHWLNIVSFTILQQKADSGGKEKCGRFPMPMAVEFFIYWIGMLSFKLSIGMLFVLILDRIQALEASTWQSLRSRLLWCLAILCVVLMVVLDALSVPKSVPNETKVVSGVLLGAAIVIVSLIFIILATIAFCKPLQVLRKSTDILQGSALVEAKKGVGNVRLQIIGLSLGAFVLALRNIMTAVELINQRSLTHEFYKFAVAANNIGFAVGGVLLSGALHAVQPVRPTGAARKEQLRRRAASRLAWAPAADIAWQDKVEELAGRALSLGALLDFYAMLPNVMKHYCPKKHTTNDVVRQAIIPLTMQRCCTMAEVLMGRAYVRPKRMVTHSWSNLFRDLVASVIADAMCCSDFGFISYLLEHNFDGLVKVLQVSGKMEMTYWICAFSISQHHSICSRTMPSDIDSVTELRHPTCSCGVQKLFNDCPPLRSDGKSIPCEMNKFSDMMAYLAATDDSFEHVIAMDRCFATFTRAWVVAEIAQGNEVGLPQHLKLPNLDLLNAHEEELRHLDVNEMRASRAEDVVEILAAIPDKVAFNNYLQQILFDKSKGLLAVWKGQDAAKKLHRAGRLARLMLLSSYNPEILYE
eukprot:TRINITY_DN48922_c0_g1_i1.p1 TRINITY_DN48922_c0_g1~~TRINITY_DN48922_c0_g1_i1.p1  ORF type:complete len:695 (+),score=103.32 TRINITY_DN48922_c0_g1_i1:49-2133(+)